MYKNIGVITKEKQEEKNTTPKTVKKIPARLFTVSTKEPIFLSDNTSKILADKFFQNRIVTKNAGVSDSFGPESPGIHIAVCSL